MKCFSSENSKCKTWLRILTFICKVLWGSPIGEKCHTGAKCYFLHLYRGSSLSNQLFLLFVSLLDFHPSPRLVVNIVSDISRKLYTLLPSYSAFIPMCIFVPALASHKAPFGDMRGHERQFFKDSRTCLHSEYEN